MMKQTSKILIGSLLLAVSSLAANATGLQSHDSIRNTARQFMLSQEHIRNGEKINVKMGRLDSRLRLTACDKALTAYLPPGGRLVGNTSVGVRCDGTHPWRLYVQARVSLRKKIAVLSHALARGEQVSADDLTWQMRDLSRLPFGYISKPSGAIGKTLRQSVTEGDVLSPNLLSAALMVHRGQTVTLLAGGSALTVRMSGRALMDGSRGDLVKVRNPHSRRIVQGTVVGDAQVRIGS